MLGNRLTTIQTPSDGIEVKTVYVAECLDFDKEFYFAIVFDRGYQAPVMIASKEGGVEIEEVSKHNPDAIIKEPIDTKTGPTAKQLKRLGTSLGLEGDVLKQAETLMANFYKLMVREFTCDILG
jgi:succinyl-CoA synthetase beta subunit